MILTCPACGTQYVVKDGAIPATGRKVRCAACRHSWHQDPEPIEGPLELQEPIEAEESEVPQTPLDNQTGADESDAPEYSPAPERELGDPAAYSDAGGDRSSEHDSGPDEQFDAGASWEEPPTTEPAAAAFAAQPQTPAFPIEPAITADQADDEVDDDFSPFAERSPAERRRRSPLAAILLVTVVVAALAAAFWFLAPPEWKARVGLAQASQTPLQLMLTHRDRQALASGNELLAVSGRVINPTSVAQRVPPIQAELRSSSGKLVYRWTISPPTPTLAPGASAPFNSAEVNVPSGGEELTVSLGPPGA